MELDKQLKLAGLNNSEITVYLFLLENGLSTPPIVSRGTNIARTNCYNILEELETKGLIEEQIVGKRKAYLAKDPEAIIRSLEQKKEAIVRVLPDLYGLYTLQKNKPKIRYYDGFEGIKAIYLDALSAKKIMNISSGIFFELDRDFYLNYLNELKTKTVAFHDIRKNLPPDKIISEAKTALNDLYDIRLLPEKHNDFPVDILLWNDNVAFITLDDPKFGTVLTNKLLAQTFATIFETFWNP